jgi:hypothetical protein
MKYVKENFETMGFSLTDLFSSKKTYSPAENLASGKTWIKKIYTDLKPNATFAVFEDTLRLTPSGAPKLSDSELNDFYTTLGSIVNESSAIADKVRNSLLATFSKNKNMLPDRRSIMSAFLNPDIIKWTYWDALKVTAKDISTEAKGVVSDIATVATTTTGAVSFIVKYRNPIILVALAGLGYFLYQNRGEIKSRVKEKTFKKLGLGK